MTEDPGSDEHIHPKSEKTLKDYVTHSTACSHNTWLSVHCAGYRVETRVETCVEGHDNYQGFSNLKDGLL